VVPSTGSVFIAAFGGVSVRQAHVLSHASGTLQAMVSTFHHFSPHRAESRPCWHCISFGGMLYEGTAARCDRPGAPPVQAGPKIGCAFWSREVGSDDEPGPPVAPWDAVCVGAKSLSGDAL
jgi:hypothetical protein